MQQKSSLPMRDPTDRPSLLLLAISSLQTSKDYDKVLS